MYVASENIALNFNKNVFLKETEALANRATHSITYDDGRDHRPSSVEFEIDKFDAISCDTTTIKGKMLYWGINKCRWDITIPTEKRPNYGFEYSQKRDGRTPEELVEEMKKIAALCSLTFDFVETSPIIDAMREKKGRFNVIIDPHQLKHTILD